MTSHADRREFLLAAIADAEGTIRATDTKASIALVLHGLLFSGFLAVIGDLGSIFECASETSRAVLVGSAALGGLAFVVSVLQLLRCIRPAPVGAIPDLPNGKMAGTFFLRGRPNSFTGRWKPERLPATLQFELTRLDDAAMTQELAGELIKLSAIRGRKTALIQSGVAWLRWSFLAIVVFLSTAGLELI